MKLLVCLNCGKAILDKFLFKIDDYFWHEACLKCYHCRCDLHKNPTCFIKLNNLYCKSDYAKCFGQGCAKCYQKIEPNDWVRKAKNNIYHLACFVCDACQRQLSTGEEFILVEDKVICKNHYTQPDEDSDDTCDDNNSSETDSRYKHKSKRIRTTFTEEQIQILQTNFLVDSNPDGVDLERLSQITGLSKRVVQVWFQNSRARQKKYVKPFDPRLLGYNYTGQSYGSYSFTIPYLNSDDTTSPPPLNDKMAEGESYFKQESDAS